jgi:hypothetical protein
VWFAKLWILLELSATPNVRRDTRSLEESNQRGVVLPFGRIQMALDVAYDRAVVDHLIWSSLWLRDIPGAIRAAVAAYMLRLVASGSTAVRGTAAKIDLAG